MNQSMYCLILPTVQATVRPESSSKIRKNNNIDNIKSKRHLRSILARGWLTTFARPILLLTCGAFLLLDMLQLASAGMRTDDDYCGTLRTSKLHGYEVEEHKLLLNDNYELKLHRLVHPEDQQRPGAAESERRKKPKKKPYLLVHGLIGSSAGFVTNIDPNYRAPAKSFDAWTSIERLLDSKAHLYQYNWKSTAENQRRTCHYEEPIKRFNGDRPKHHFADSFELQFNAKHMDFEREFRQAYNKYELPNEAVGNTTNSLAFTLSNFGYDVWMVNLRGNQYSLFYNGPHSAQRPEYWNFSIETIIKEDMAATIQYIYQKAQLPKRESIGMVTYSYSSMYVMGLLTKFPAYHKKLRPIIMLAPTMLVGGRTQSLSTALMTVINRLVSRNGPIPVLHESTSNDAKLTVAMKFMCKHVAVVKKLCNMMQSVILGRAKETLSVRGLVMTSRTEKLWRRDVSCGRTSRQILHQIFKHMKGYSINPNYKPFVAAGVSYMRPGDDEDWDKLGSIMLVHSKDDEISTEDEVTRLRDRAFKTMTLVDYLVREPNFGHADFLFSAKNEYLINAEVARMATVHDYLLHFKPRPVIRRP